MAEGYERKLVERPRDPRRVEPVRGPVLRSRAVVAELRVRDAEREQPVRPVAERDGDLGRRGAGEVRLDEDDVRPVPERVAQLVVRERAHGRDVRDRDVAVGGRLEDRGQRRADRDDERRAGRAVSQHREPAGVDSGVVRLLAQPDVDAAVASECLPEQPVGLVDVSGHVDRPAGKRRDERDVLGRLVRAPLARRVVGRADADEDGAEVVVAEVELEHLVRPLDEERRVRVSDGPVALEREPGGDADHQLLADADVEVARMLADRVGRRSAR